MDAFAFLTSEVQILNMILSLRRMARKPIGAKSTNLSSKLYELPKVSYENANVNYTAYLRCMNFLFSHAEASQGRREGVGSASSTAV
jgi:hypothetical protein